MRNLVTWCNFVFAVNNVNVKFNNLSHNPRVSYIEGFEKM